MCIRDRQGDARFHLARPVGVDQATGGGRAADADEQHQGDKTQDAHTHTAAAAPRALGGQIGRDVLNGLLVGLHKSLREPPSSQMISVKTSNVDGVVSAQLLDVRSGQKGSLFTV